MAATLDVSLSLSLPPFPSLEISKLNLKKKKKNCQILEKFGREKSIKQKENSCPFNIVKMT